MADALEGKLFKASNVSVLADLGLVVGKAVVCTEKGEDHYDLQGDHIPKDVAGKGLLDFFGGPRVHKVMHNGEPAGEIELGWLFTEEINKIIGVQADWEGIAIAFRPAPAIMAKYESGEFRGFSIGGSCSYNEEPA